MEIVGQLAGGVVHDFNNILTVITGTIDILAEAVADRPDLAAIAGLIAEAAARGANLTAHLLAFARSQPSRPRDVDVNALLVEAARLLRPTLGERIDVVSIPAAHVASARVDPSELMTAILNLAIVARDAMPQGGTLTFAASSPVAGDGCEVLAADHVMIAVIATGYGTSESRPDAVFAGLGVLQDSTAQCNGQIRMRNSGTSVEIYLPSAVGLARPLGEDCSAALAGGHEAILIVEDDVLVRRYVITQLQSLGYLTLAAGDASEALAIIDEGKRIDLLFTDVMIPGSIDGRQLAIEALKRRPLLKILYTSGYSESAMVRDGRLDACTLLLAKPYRKAQLAKMIRAALAA